MILYAEDTKAIAESVVAYLEQAWFSVDRYDNGAKALEAIGQKRYDAYVLDIMLPWVDGKELCYHIRKKSESPIIMTTARWTIDDKSEFYDKGVDDYLVKPFALEELVMRLQAIIKRTAVSDQIHLGDIEIYIDENRVTKAGKEIWLPLKEWLILMELIDARGMTVPRSQLIDTLRGADALFENNDNKIDVYIASLRKKLGKEMIDTIKGVGYKIHLVH